MIEFIFDLKYPKDTLLPRRRRAVARETLYFFVQLRQELGLGKAAGELRSLAERELGEVSRD